MKEAIINRHPAVFEALLNENNIPELAVPYPDTVRSHFIPGLAALAPCTSENYTLEMIGKGCRPGLERDAAETKCSGVHRSKNPTAGSFSYYPSVQFRVRCVLTMRYIESE